MTRRRANHLIKKLEQMRIVCTAIIEEIPCQEIQIIHPLQSAIDGMGQAVNGLHEALNEALTETS